CVKIFGCPLPRTFALAPKYTFSGSSSTIWDSFSPYHRSDSAYMRPTAIFLGWIAQEIGTKFGVSSSSAGMDEALSFFNEQTQFNASAIKYSWYSLLEMIKNGYPVFVRASTSDKKGHAWLIDYYKSDHYEYTNYYAYLQRSTDPDPNEEDEVDDELIMNPSVGLIKSIYGDVEVEMKVHAYDKSYLKCNWGWSDSYADNYVTLDANILSWSMYDHVFDSNHYIFYFKTPSAK
ncbi:MAG: C10 family peptidase, partial [Bacteroides sp.]|nr:C10 family peptidase [Bacteroides sp.]